MKKIVAITGAYGGLGAALTELMVKKGYSLVLGGRNKDKLEELANKLKNITKVVTAILDVRKKLECADFINTAVREFGRIDILINNAGVLYELKPIEKVNEQELLDTFQTNFFGAFFCIQAALPIMKKQKGGCVINIGSTSAIDYKSNHAVYGPSKSAIVNLTGSLRKELDGTGIKMIVINPGGMKTSLFRQQAKINIQEFMDPKDVAEKIVYYIENPSDEWNITLRRPQ